MKCSRYDHRNGATAVPRSLQEEVSDAIESVSLKIRKGATSALRDEVLQRLLEKGWSSKASISTASGITITSMKSGIGLCLQTGNMARIYADMLKLQKLFFDKSISAAVMIVPSHPIARLLGDNIAHASRLQRELAIFENVIQIPILLFAME